MERFSCNLVEHLFGHQYAVELRLPTGQKFSEWVVPLPAMVSSLNVEVTCLTGKKPSEAIKQKAVYSKPSTPYNRPVDLHKKWIPSSVVVHYLHQPDELEGGRKRATDPIRSLKVYHIEKTITKPNQPILYYLHVPKHGFVPRNLSCLPTLSCHLPHSSSHSSISHSSSSTSMWYSINTMWLLFSRTQCLS